MSTVFIALVAIGSLFMLVGTVAFIVAGFRESVWWGLGMLFLGSLVQLVFLFMYWNESKQAFLIQALGVLLLAGGIGAAVRSSVDEGRATAWFEEVKTRVASLGAVPWKEDSAAESKTRERRPAATRDFSGKTLAEVKEELGKPQGELTTESGTLYYYPDVELFSSDGIHVTSQGLPSALR